MTASFSWRGRKVVVTGGSGFIGTNLIEYLNGQGAHVTSIDFRPPANPVHTPLWHDADIRDAGAMRRLIHGADPEYVFHLAARVDLLGRTAEDYDTNTRGTESVMAALEGLSGIKGVVFFSSMLVCVPGYSPVSELDYKPGTAYGESKVAMEKIIRAANLPYPWVFVRPTSIWGPWFGEPYLNFFNHVLNGRYAHVSAPMARKTLGYVDNAVGQVCALAENLPACAGRAFYLGDGDFPISQWADLIREQSALPPVRTVPLAIFRAAALAGDLLTRLGLPFPMNSYRLSNLLRDNVQDVSPVLRVSGPPGVNFAEGIARTLAWLRTRA